MEEIIIPGLITLASISSLLLLRHEKHKAGGGLPSQTGHGKSRYRILWLLIYTLAIPTALIIHAIKLIRKILQAIMRGFWRWLS